MPIDGFAADDGAFDGNVHDGAGIDGAGVFGENDQVGEFACLDGTFYVFLEGGVGAVDGVELEGFIDGDALLRPPDVAVVVFASDAALDAHEGRERAARVVGGAGGVDAVVDEGALGEHPLEAFLAVEAHLFAVVVDVGAEGGDDAAGGFDSPQQVRVDDAAMFDAMAGIFSGKGALGLFVGGHDSVDGAVAVGVDAHLESCFVGFQHPMFSFFGVHDGEAVVAAAADVGLVQVGGAGGDGAVGDHFDSADAETVVAEAGADSGVSEGGEVVAVHEQVDAEGELAGVFGLLVDAEVVDGDHRVVDGGEARLGEHAAD